MNPFQFAIKNWKTTSAGVVIIGNALIHFWSIRHIAAEGDLTYCFGQIIVGAGFVFAGDASHSQAQVQDVKQAVADAIDTGDTSHLKKDQTDKPKDQP